MELVYLEMPITDIGNINILYHAMFHRHWHEIEQIVSVLKHESITLLL